MENQKTQNNPDKDRFKGLEKYARYSSMAFQMIAVMLLFVWGGIKLDSLRTAEGPLFVIIFSIMGVFAALYLALKDFITPNKKDKNH